MKKIIISGGLGFIGSHIVNKLLNANCIILNIDKENYASRINFRPKKNYVFIKLDIRDKKIHSILKKFNPDVVVNCAAESHVDRSIKNPKLFVKNNIEGTLNLLEATKKLEKKIQFIQISTDEVYGSLPLNKMKFNYKSPYNPQSPYSASKASSDHLVRSYGNTYGLNYTITHCTNNFGPYQFPEKFIPVIINSCINKKEIPIYGNGLNIRDWIYVEDHAAAIKKIIFNNHKNQICLIGASNEISNVKLAKKICDIFSEKFGDFEYKKLIKFVDDRKGHDLRYALSNSKFTKNYNWNPKISFEKGLIKTVNFYIKNKDNLKKIFRF